MGPLLLLHAPMSTVPAPDKATNQVNQLRLDRNMTDSPRGELLQVAQCHVVNDLAQLPEIELEVGQS
jgi:hypothetical protein